MKRALIAGCGYVGTELAGRLLLSGETEVFGLRRNPGTLPSSIRPIACDLASGDGLDALPGALDVLFYTVGADASTPEAYRRAYVTGLRNLCAALRARGALPPRMLVVTSTAVYGQNDGSAVDESSPTEPAGFSGQILLESEHAAREFVATAVAVRFAGIYGPGRDRFVESVRTGTATLTPGKEFTNRIHRDDCAGVLAHLAALPAPAPVYIGVDDEPADRREVVAWLAARLGVEAPPEPRVENNALPPPRGKRCSNRRVRESGFVFRYPTYREGYGAMLDRSASLATSPRRT